MKQRFVYLIVKILSFINNTHKQDLLDRLQYLIFSAKGHYRGFYNLDLEVKICSDLIKKSVGGSDSNSIGTVIDVGANKGDFFLKIKNNFIYYGTIMNEGFL